MSNSYLYQVPLVCYNNYILHGCFHTENFCCFVGERAQFIWSGHLLFFYQRWLYYTGRSSRVVVQGPESFRVLVNFFVQRTVAELRGVGHRRMILIFQCDSRRSKKLPSGIGSYSNKSQEVYFFAYSVKLHSVCVQLMKNNELRRSTG